MTRDTVFSGEASRLPLRLRLSITLVAIVLVPLTVTALIVLLIVDGQQDARTRERLSFTTARVDAVLDQYSQRAQTSAADVANSGLATALAGRRTADLERLTAQFARPARIDFLAVTDTAGGILTYAEARTPAFLPDVILPAAATRLRAAAIADDRSVDPYAVYGSVVVRSNGRNLGRVVAGFWLDNYTLDRVQPSDDTELTLVADRVAIATTEGPSVDLEPLIAVEPDARTSTIGDRVASATRLLTRGPVIVVTGAAATGAEARGAISGILAVLAAFVVLAGLLGWLMARVTTKPLAELSEAALAVASGRLDTRFEVRSSKDEVGRLALAFNTMTDELRTYIGALQDSRDELKRNLTRLGETLSSTHDLRKMLSVILETAMVTARADAGSLMLVTSDRNDLYLKVGRGLDGRLSGLSTRMRVGDGVAGKVAATGESLHGRVGDRPGELQLAGAEPKAEHVISVPFKSQGRVIGVLNLYDRAGGGGFDENDVSTIRSFAHQATAAIENVLLHQEAQRLSITDGLTGLWNYRYFQMSFDKEIERATRFSRPLALLILDLDKFKAINDVYGHQRGDAVLIELAARVKGAIREVDTLARYGGEEFVLILPETDLDGAVQAAAKICETVRQRRFGAASEEPIRVTVSIGVSVFPLHGRTATELLKAADGALYAAKEGGRDRHSVAVEEIEGEFADAPVAPVEAPPAPVAALALPTGQDLLDLLDDSEPELGPAPGATAVAELPVGELPVGELPVGDLPVGEPGDSAVEQPAVAEPAVPDEPAAAEPAVPDEPAAAEPVMPAEPAAAEVPAGPAVAAAVVSPVVATGAGGAPRRHPGRKGHPKRGASRSSAKRRRGRR